MKIKKLVLGGAFLTILSPAFSLATPVKYAKCPVNIKEPKLSSGYYFNEDCSIAYVLPPRLGSLDVTNFRKSINTNTICSALHSVESSNTDNEAVRANFAKTLRKKSKKLAELQDQYEDGDYPDGMSEEELLEQIMKLSNFINQMNESFAFQYEDYIKRKGRYAIEEGGEGNFKIVSGYTELIEDFDSKNKDAGVKFSRMPFLKNFVSINDKGFDSDQAQMEMKAVKRLMIPSADGKTEDVRVMQTATSIASKDLRNDGNPDASGAKIFGDAISGHIEMSSAGVCALEREIGPQDSFNANDLKGSISANALYQYDVEVERSYYVTYSMRELIHVIRESSKRGGFFSRRTVNRLIENRESDSWITFHSESNDSRYEYTPEEIKEIKADFIDRALRQVIAIKGDGKISPLVLIDPSGKNGAQTIGDELSKCPHLYCQIGAAGFKILGSIFGSETATSELKKKLSVNAKEEVKEKKMMKFVGSMTFE